jgi:HD-GYP domain-containing protein (c-di-GMP phosphodiesterase class II)
LFCGAIAQRLNFDHDAINQIKIAGLMHDIGKIGIAESILNKKEKLTADEWKELERHPEIGYRILSSVNEFSEIAEYVLGHHEKWDGSGYPKGLGGQKIPLQSRIIAVADAFDAMTSERTYKEKISEKEAVDELRRGAGKQFDPNVVAAFIRDVLEIE